MTTFRSKMRRLYIQVVYSLCTLCVPVATAAEAIPVPSGQPLTFLEFISELEGDLVRFRFLAPDIGEGLPFDQAFADFQVLCDEQVMPALSANALTPSQIVLSMSAQDIPFGEDNPDVLQFFEVFRVENGLCIREEF